MDAAKVEAVIKNDLTWLQRHEKLVLAFVAGLVLLLSIGKIDTLIANHDKANLTQATEISKVQAEKDAVTAVLALQEREQYKALSEQVAAQNAQLEQANAALVTALSKQQKVDAQLPPTELAVRWNKLVPQADATVTPTGLTVPQVGAVATVQALEEAPVLRTQLENERTQNGNTTTLLTASRTQVGTLEEQVTGLKLELTDNAKVCKDQIAVVKAEGRKSKLHWFEAGFLTGLVTRGVIKLTTGL